MKSSLTLLALALSVVALLPCCVVALTPAVATNVAQNGVQNMINKILPVEVAKIKGLHLPDINGEKSGFNYHITNIVIQQVGYGSAPVNMQKDLAFGITGIGVHITLNWAYKLKSWPHVPYGSGTADVTASDSAGSVAVSSGLNAGKPVFVVDAASVALNKIDVKVHGSIFSWLYDIIISLFKGSIKSAAEKAIRDQLVSLINVKLNQIVSSMSFHEKIDDNTLLNWELVAAPSFPGDNSMLVQLNGGFEVINPPQQCPLPRAAVQTQRSGRMIDIAMDQFFVDSALWAYYTQGKLARMIKPTDIDPKSPIQLNTSSFALVFPALYIAYPNKLMELYVHSTAPPSLALDPKDTSLKALTNIDVSVDTTGQGAWKEVFTLSTTLGLAATANVTSQTFYMNFDQLSFQLVLVNSTIGQFDVTILNALIALSINTVILPEINKIANHGVPLPTIAGLSFQNTKLAINNGFFDIATDFDYKPAQAGMEEEEEIIWTDWMIEFKAGKWPTVDAIDISSA